jgi:hypothetical protein
MQCMTEVHFNCQVKSFTFNTADLNSVRSFIRSFEVEE